MSSFFDKIDQAQTLLQKSGRISLRALGREFSLDEEELEDLVEELVDVREVATRDNRILVSTTSAEAAPPIDTRERRQLTVMFCDLVGSTALSQQLDPEELSNILTHYRAICDDATRAVDGHVAQYLGDGVMIYFGFPQAQEDAADRAVRTGLEIQRVMKQRFQDRIQARIGVHTGTVVVDQSAAGDKALALGATTNVAARVEGMAKAGTVLVSKATLANCRGGYATKSLGEVELKGIEDAIELIEIEGLRQLRHAPEGSSSQSMVGRTSELAELLDSWQAATAGQGRVALLVGEAGIGKSTLVQAFRERIAEHPHRWLDMQCSPFTSGSAFQPIIDLQRSIFGLQDGASGSESRDRLVAGVEAIEGIDGSRVIPYLVALLQLPASDRYPMVEVSSGEQRERTIQAMIALLTSLCAETPVVVMLEDVHWSDPSTLDVLGRLVEDMAEKQLMLVVTSRPLGEPPWEHPHVSTISLRGLSSEATRRMILAAAGGELPEELLSVLTSRSDGVPLFISALTANVIESAGMIEQDGGYRLKAGLNDLAIPMTLQDSLMARLDRVGAAKIVAQHAATLGREFSWQLIDAIADRDEASLRASLAELVRGGILDQHGEHPQTTYTFKHALLQDAAYESQLRSTRRDLHSRIVKALQSKFPLQVQSEPDVIARHCAAAGLHGEAVDYYQRAAQLAEQRLSNREAADHYQLALDALAALDEDDGRVQREIAIRLAQNKAQVAMHGYEHPDVIANIDRIEELCDYFEEGPNQLPALLGLVQLDLNKGDNPNCRERGHKILEIAEPMGIPFVIGVAKLIIGGTDILLGDSMGGRDILSSAIDTPELAQLPPPATSNDVELLSTLYATYATGLANCAQFDQCRAACAKSIERAREHGNDLTRGQVFSIAAICGNIMGDPVYARDMGQEAMDLIRGRGFHTPHLMAVFSLGWALTSLDDKEGGIACVEEGLEVYRTTGSVSGIELLHVMAADAHCMAGNFERALELTHDAERLSKDRGSFGYMARILISRGGIAVASHNDVATAESLFLQAYELALENRWITDQLSSATALARLASTRDQAAEAVARLQTVYGSISEGLDLPGLVRARAALEELAPQASA